MPKRKSASRQAARANRQAAEAGERAAKRAVRAAYEREAAIRAEAIAEDQAPAIQRQCVVDADGVILRDPLAVPDLKRGGYRRSDPLLHLKAKGTVTTLECAAATKFSRDYEVGVCGAVTGAGDYERVDGSTSDGAAAERCLKALTRYREACDAMPAHKRTITQWVALHRWPITLVMKTAGIGYERAMDYLTDGLEALTDFYFPDRPAETSVVIREIVDPSVQDVPQERLGRRKLAA